MRFFQRFRGALKKCFNSGQQRAAIVEWSSRAPSSIGKRYLKMPRPLATKVASLRAYGHQVRLRGLPQPKCARPWSATVSGSETMRQHRGEAWQEDTRRLCLRGKGVPKEEGLGGGTPLAAISIARAYGPFGRKALTFHACLGILLASASLFDMAEARCTLTM